jgi:hypothetical protein
MRKSLLAGFAAGVAALLAVPSLSSAQEEVFQSTLGELLVKGNNPLTSFDISWVDPNLGGSGLPFYFLGDRSNAQVDSIPIGVNPPSFFIKNAAFPFSGTAVCPDTGSTTDCAGPNGVLSLVGPDDQFEIWVGDGPTANAFCPAGFSPCSTVKVFQNFTANLLAVIPTAVNSTFPGKKRADELCFAKAVPGAGGHPGTILVANDADETPYISFIATDGPNRMKILKQIPFANAAAGIEQCQFDPHSGLFLLNLPEDSDHGTLGAVHRFDPVTLNEVLPPFVIPDVWCHHPQGMAIDAANNPSHVLLGCNGASSDGHLNSVIITGDDGDLVAVLTDQGAADEVWWEPGSHHFFLAEGRCSADCGPGAAMPPPLGDKQGLQTLGIIDSPIADGALNDPFFGGQNVFVAFQGNTTRNAHSVAAWSGALGGLGNFVIAFVPVPATGGAPAGSGTAGYSSTLCNQFSAQGCIAMISVSPIPGPAEF